MSTINRKVKNAAFAFAVAAGLTATAGFATDNDALKEGSVTTLIASGIIGGAANTRENTL